jgi:hypothetical protein
VPSSGTNLLGVLGGSAFPAGEGLSAVEQLPARDLLFLRCMKKHTQPSDLNNSSGLQKNPDEWKTGDEPMTAAQRSYLDTLSSDTGEEIETDLTKAEASKKIDELRERSPRVHTDDGTKSSN